jgi:glycosyltransferase involved in cell wall biosynthesis
MVARVYTQLRIAVFCRAILHLTCRVGYNESMTLTVDCRQIEDSGVGVYIRECLPIFLESGNSFVLLGDAEKLSFLRADGRRVRIVACSIKPFSLQELFFFPRRIAKIINKTDLFYSPFFNIPSGIKVPVFTTIHDIIFPDRPELTGRAGLAARMWFYRRAARKSKTIFTVSEFSKSRITHHLGERRVIVTYSAVRASLSDTTALTAEKTDTLTAEKNKSILFIGNIKKHKGLSILLEALNKAREEGLEHTLVIVGSEENFRSTDTGLVKQMKGRDIPAVRWTGHIADVGLRRLIAEAALLVQPSLYEGFCLPPLEAMMLGTPALISDIPVLREIYGPLPGVGQGGRKGYPVTFFKAGDAEDLKEKLIELLHGKAPAPVRLDGELRNRYTFTKTSSIILEELREAVTDRIC